MKQEGVFTFNKSSPFGLWCCLNSSCFYAKELLTPVVDNVGSQGSCWRLGRMNTSLLFQKLSLAWLQQTQGCYLSGLCRSHGHNSCSSTSSASSVITINLQRIWHVVLTITALFYYCICASLEKGTSVVTRSWIIAHRLKKKDKKVWISCKGNIWLFKR